MWLFQDRQSVKKVEVQEALPPAGVIGAEPLTLVPQHFPRKPAQRCLRAITANSGFFDRLSGAEHQRRSVCQRSPIAMQQWGFKHEKSRERKKGCHLWMASFLRFIAANLSLTHAVTAVSPR